MRWRTELPAAALALALGLGSGCTIGRTYAGAEIREEPAVRIEAGRTSRAEVLQVFGPPDRILRRANGDVFVYLFERTNETTFTLEEPVFTNFVLFAWSKVQRKSDRLTIFFDGEGTVTAYGHRRGTQELEPL
jgi:hypothetical protein